MISSSVKKWVQILSDYTLVSSLTYESFPMPYAQCHFLTSILLIFSPLSYHLSPSFSFPLALTVIVQMQTPHIMIFFIFILAPSFIPKPHAYMLQVTSRNIKICHSFRKHTETKNCKISYRCVSALNHCFSFALTAKLNHEPKFRFNYVELNQWKIQWVSRSP